MYACVLFLCVCVCETYNFCSGRKVSQPWQKLLYVVCQCLYAQSNVSSAEDDSHNRPQGKHLPFVSRTLEPFYEAEDLPNGCKSYCLSGSRMPIVLLTQASCQLMSPCY